MKTLRQMTDEVRELNTAKGWRDTTNSIREYSTLLHSEVSEMLEAWRDRRLAEYTTAMGKPDDVRSEAADVLIRLLDTCDVTGRNLYDLDMELGDVDPIDPEEWPDPPVSFADWTDWLHEHIAEFRPRGVLGGPLLLRALVAFTERWGINLEAEYERKMAFNWTRPFQHGGRTLNDPTVPL